MTSFQSKIGWKRLKKQKIKVINPFRSYPPLNRKLKKNSKKIQKIKKPRYDFFSSQNRLEKAEKERKQKLSFRSVPTQRVIENSKKIAKKFKNSVMASFQDKIGWKKERKRENKNYCSHLFLPDT